MSAPDSDQLLQDYRRASAAQAGSPPPALRKTILAEAAAAARKRTPAANDSRFHWRAVAGVAVLGVAVLLWRQVDHRLPTVPREIVPAPVASAPPSDEAAGLSRETPASERAAQPAAESAGQAVVADSAAPAAARTPPAPVPAPEPAPPPPTMAKAESQLRARAGAQQAEMQMADASRIEAPAQGAMPTARARPDSSATALLRRHFPEQYSSARPAPALWLVLDEAGNVLRSGELDAGVDLATITQTIGPALAGRRLGPWRTDTVPNAQNLPVQINVARTQ